MKLHSKLMLTYVACGLIPLAIAATASYILASRGVSDVATKADLEQRVTESLVAQRTLKRAQLEDYFHAIRDQIITFSSNPATVNAMSEFRLAFADYSADAEISDDQLQEMKGELARYYNGAFASEYRSQNDGQQPNTSAMLGRLDNDSVAIQHAYIQANQHPLGSKHLLERAEGASVYHEIHSEFHPSTRQFLEKFGYYDIFLIDHTSGDIVYSVFKELDFTTSLLNGPFSDTNFGEAFRAARSLSPGEFVFVDYKQYTPSYEAPASFVASPIFDGGKRVGVAMFQLPLDRITAIMSHREGLGESGETFLVGRDFLMRSDSHHDPKNRSVVASFRKPTEGKVENASVLAAIDRGEESSAVQTDYRGKETLVAYGPVDVLGTTWCLNAKMDTEEAYRELREVAAASSAAKKEIASWNAILALVVTILVGVVAWLISRYLLPSVKAAAENQGHVNAIHKTQAVIEFDLDGNILTANDNFLNAMGYSLDEIKGQHHRMFVDPEYARSPEYREFWSKLNRGEFVSGQFKRLRKGGTEIWIEASYNPVRDQNGKLSKVVKFAVDVTERVHKLSNAETLRSVVENSEAAFMMVDRDFVVTYMNEASRQLLTGHQNTFRKFWPKFDPNNIVGQCIDQFHKNPQHQRTLLADPSNLPLKTDIEVGPLTVALTVTALEDAQGNYTGNALEWKDVTEDRKREARAQKVANFQEREVETFSTIMTRIAEGDLTQYYQVADADEDTAEVCSTFSNIAKAVNGMCDNLREVIGGLASNSRMLASSSTELSSTATQLAGGAEETTSQSATVAAAAEEMSLNMNNMTSSTEQVTQNVKTVADAVQELNKSIGEIAQTAEEASSVAETASQLTQSSNETIGELGTAAEEIGKVIEVIQDIAEQTNLLALNATIEAARAGDAGKGFAVVATEVKELARQTAGATEDIRNRIQRIQGSTGEAVRSIGEVGDVIQKVNDASTTIASAVEEQSIITKEVAGKIDSTAEAVTTVATGVGESATACDEVARNIAGVDTAAKQTAEGAAQLQSVGAELSQLSEKLQATVGRFEFANESGGKAPSGNEPQEMGADSNAHQPSLAV